MKGVGGEFSVDLLCAALKNKDPNMRQQAASALGGKRDARAVEPLITCLNDPIPAVAISAAGALGLIGERRAIDPLVACLKLDSQIAKAAAQALSKLSYLPQNDQDRIQYFLALDQWEKLSTQGTAVVEPLIKCLETNRNVSRPRIVQLLVKLGDPRATDALVHCLQKDSDAGCRTLAAEGLGAFGDTRALIPLLVALDHPQVNVRDAAALALGKLGARLGNKRPCTALIACLRDNEVRVRASAAESLGLLGDPAAIQPLVRTLSCTNALVRDRAASALIKLGYSPSTDEEKATLYLAQRAWANLRKLGSSAVPALLACLAERSEPYLQMDALKSLGELRDPRAFEPVAACLRDASSGIRASAATALGALGDARAVSLLTGCLNDRDRNVRDKASQALTKLRANSPARAPTVTGAIKPTRG